MKILVIDTVGVADEIAEVARRTLVGKTVDIVSKCDNIPEDRFVILVTSFPCVTVPGVNRYVSLCCMDTGMDAQLRSAFMEGVFA